MVIGRKKVTSGKEYTRIWIYVPTKVAEDSGFPFSVGDPCDVTLDTKTSELFIRPIKEEQARE